MQVNDLKIFKGYSFSDFDIFHLKLYFCISQAANVKVSTYISCLICAENIGATLGHGSSRAIESV